MWTGESGAVGAAPLFAALGDATRLRLVDRLAGAGPLSIAQLTGATEVTRQAVRKHLAVLEGAGLVHGTRRGRERVWALRPVRLDEARRTLEGISEAWDLALERLRAYVEV